MNIQFKEDVVKQLSIKQVWSDHHNTRIEEQCMSPFIAANVDRFRDVTGYNLEVKAMEKHEGNFRADIICTDVDTDRTVVIENMLGSTDHDHIGKVITYTSCENAECCIIVCENARDEHISAVKSLNTHGYEVYLFELKFEEYNGNALAEFVLKAGPEISHTGTESGNSKYAEFFDRFISELKEDIPTCHFNPNKPYQGLISKKGIWAAIVRSIGKPNVLHFEFGRSMDTPEIVSEFDRIVAAAEAKIGAGSFEEVPGKKNPSYMRRIYTIDNFSEQHLDRCKDICRKMVAAFNAE